MCPTGSFGDRFAREVVRAGRSSVASCAWSCQGTPVSFVSRGSRVARAFPALPFLTHGDRRTDCLLRTAELDGLPRTRDTAERPSTRRATMSITQSSILLATICNTVGEASPHALWFADSGRQFVADLSDEISDASGFTGIAYHKDRLYLAVQSAAARILVLDQHLNVIETITHELFNDLHSLHVIGDMLLIVSARAGALVRRNLNTGETVAHIRFDPRAWVCDALCLPDDIWLCCHHLTFLDPVAKEGGLFSVREHRAILDGFSHPHSIIPYRDEFAILDSARAQLVFFRLGGSRRSVQLQGFLRGVVRTGDDSLLVAGGPHRTVSRKNPEGGDHRADLRQVLDERLRLFEVTNGTAARVILPEVPGFEMYDLCLLPAGLLQPAPERALQVETGLFARFWYTSLIAAQIKASKSR
jgi:hypothetical protein